METTLSQPFNAAQLLLVQTFARLTSEQEKEEIQSLLLDYYHKKVDSQIDKFDWSNDKINDILNTHLRTPYK